MTFENLHALPTTFPIPKLDRHVVASGQDKRLCGMHNDGTDVIRMCLEGGDLLIGVVVVDAQLEVIATAYNPVFPSDEATSANGHIGELEGLDDRLRLVRPDVDMAAVKRRENLIELANCASDAGVDLASVDLVVHDSDASRRRRLSVSQSCCRSSSSSPFTRPQTSQVATDLAYQSVASQIATGTIVNMKFATIANTAILATTVTARSTSYFSSDRKGQSPALSPLEDKFSVPGENPLAHCADPKDDILDLISVDLTPNPPKAGSSLSITAKGQLSEEVEDGAKIHLSVKYGVITIIRSTADLCENVDKVDLKCPLPKDEETTITKDVELPKEIPPGKYTVVADIVTKNETKITCLTATVEFHRGGGMAFFSDDL
nr:phosphatidylglycerol/phosphatidylinositol transfer protein [Quercus suber]